jgi:hypothetical protein
MTERVTPLLYVVKPTVETINVYAYSQQSHGEISWWREVSHKPLLWVRGQIGFISPPHKMFFRTYIYHQGSVTKTVILEATVHAQGTNILLAYGIFWPIKQQLKNLFISQRHFVVSLSQDT